MILFLEEGKKIKNRNKELKNQIMIFRNQDCLLNSKTLVKIS
ncbi:hypothetical protein LEP1GSC171_2084 [Leptospira santarosai str. HAI1380]|nr:hypothetical protein LEP1GSC171_2084 [Leptospira santarosai str. HAI1380]